MNTVVIQDQLIENSFYAQKEYASIAKSHTYRERLNHLDLIYKYLENEQNINRLCEAMYKDFKKSVAEVHATEIGVIKASIKYIKKHLRDWMHKKFVPAPLSLYGTHSYVHHEAKGVCLIIAPWNYPFQLSIHPLLFALAAGNTAIIKPSEYPINTSAFVNEMITTLYKPEHVKVIEGAVEVSQKLLSQPFDHIYFTGSPGVGKIVMDAAAKNLSSVTLELGGKCPTIIDETANIRKAADRTSWGKFLNMGQTCIAPDYVLVQESVYEKYLTALAKSIRNQYGKDDDTIQKNPDYCRIINDKHFNRSADLLNDAIQEGAKIELGGKLNAKERYIAPTVLSNVTMDMKVMQEEIFAPLLPIIPYKTIQDAIDIINQKEKPLAFYIFSKKKSNIKYIIDNTSAGGTMINDYHIYYANPNLPFGGIGNSGIGKSHGFYGFKEFSNERAVMHQKLGFADLLHPPYSKNTLRILKWMIRFS